VVYPSSRALRSLHLDAGRAWRGGQRQVFLLAGELRARGGEPLVFGVRGAPLLDRAQAAGLATAAASMRSDWDLRSAKRVRSVIRTWRPDVVHAHDARSHAIALIALAGDETPLIVTRRVTFPLKAVRVKYGPRVTRYIAISEAVKTAMVRDGISPHRIDIVHSGVPAPVVRLRHDWRSELRWPADTVVAGVVGAMTAEKGLEQLFHMAAWLPDDAIERTRVVLLGGQETGPATIGPLKAWRAGFVHEIYDAMAGLDILWHPSTEEGLGTALIDALALGVPPVAYAVGGVPEIIQDDVNGVLVPAGDVHAFASAHVRMLAADTRRRLGAAGPARAALFSVERMTDGIEQVYHKVLTS